jgi:hypothetical protein
MYIGIGTIVLILIIVLVILLLRRGSLTRLCAIADALSWLLLDSGPRAATPGSHRICAESSLITGRDTPAQTRGGSVPELPGWLTAAPGAVASSAAVAASTFLCRPSGLTPPCPRGRHANPARGSAAPPLTTVPAAHYRRPPTCAFAPGPACELPARTALRQEAEASDGGAGKSRVRTGPGGKNRD